MATLRAIIIQPSWIPSAKPVGPAVAAASSDLLKAVRIEFRTEGGAAAAVDPEEQRRQLYNALAVIERARDTVCTAIDKLKTSPIVSAAGMPPKP